MRLIAIFLIFELTISSYGQNFKKILIPSELDSINKGFTLIKTIDNTNCKEFFNFQGKIFISKPTSKIEYHFIGSSLKFEKDKLKAQITFDDTGRMIVYKEFNDNKDEIYYCTYEYKIIKVCLFRLEHIKLYYSPGNLRQDGWRYLKLKNSRGKNCKFSTQRMFGTWHYYYEDGTIEKTKDYGEII